MATDKYQPKTLNHPHYRKSVPQKIVSMQGDVELTNWRGDPDLFPPITVNNPEQEAFYRAKGYLAPGEPMPKSADYAEYPVMLSHPGHVDAIPDDFDIKKDTNGAIISTRIPGSPEKFPPQMAKDEAGEKVLEAKGYKRIGKADADASERAQASPFDPGFDPKEFPKMVDGKIVDPHNTMAHDRYPMWIGNVLVNDADEERAARNGESPAPILPAEKCIICGEAFGQDDEWQNGAAGPFHSKHMGAQPPSPAMKNSLKLAAPIKPAAEAKPPKDAVKSTKRQESGRKAAETRKKRQERERQAAPQGG